MQLIKDGLFFFGADKKCSNSLSWYENSDVVKKSGTGIFNLIYHNNNYLDSRG